MATLVSTKKAGGATLDVKGAAETIGPLSGAGNVALGGGTSGRLTGLSASARRRPSRWAG